MKRNTSILWQENIIQIATITISVSWVKLTSSQSLVSRDWGWREHGNWQSKLSQICLLLACTHPNSEWTLMSLLLGGPGRAEDRDARKIVLAGWIGRAKVGALYTCDHSRLERRGKEAIRASFCGWSYLCSSRFNSPCSKSMNYVNRMQGALSQVEVGAQPTKLHHMQGR